MTFAHVQTNDDTDAPDPTEINIEAHFSVIDAFDMPAVHFDSIRGGFTTLVAGLQGRYQS